MADGQFVDEADTGTAPSIDDAKRRAVELDRLQAAGLLPIQQRAAQPSAPNPILLALQRLLQGGNTFGGNKFGGQTFGGQTFGGQTFGGRRFQGQQEQPPAPPAMPQGDPQTFQPPLGPAETPQTFQPPMPTAPPKAGTQYGPGTNPILAALAPHLPQPRGAGPAAPVAPTLPAAPGRGSPLATPPTALQPPKPKYRDPMEALANPITMLALVGSLFTRQPAATALKSLTAAMKAQQQGDQQAFENEFAVYQGQVKQLHEEQQRENQEYRRELDNRRLDLQERNARIARNATRRGDRAMITATNSGNPTAVEDLLKARQAAVDKLGQGVNESQTVKELYAEFGGKIDKTTLHGMVQRAKGGKQNQALGDFTKEGQAFIDSIPPEFRDRVVAGARGDAPIPTGRWAQPFADAVYHLNKNMRGSTYAGRTSATRYWAGGQGVGQLNSLGQMMGHIQNALQSSQELGLTEWRTANKGIVAWGKETNDPAVARFVTDLHVIRDESANVFKNNRATDSEIKRNIELIEDTSSPEYLATQLQELARLISSRMEQMAYTISRTTGEPMGMIDLLSPHAQEAYKQALGAGQQPKPQAGGAGSSPETAKEVTEEEYKNLPNGTWYKRDGKAYQKAE
jgi:hypothetical protein